MKADLVIIRCSLGFQCALFRQVVIIRCSLGFQCALFRQASASRPDQQAFPVCVFAEKERRDGPQFPGIRS